MLLLCTDGFWAGLHDAQIASVRATDARAAREASSDSLADLGERAVQAIRSARDNTTGRVPCAGSGSTDIGAGRCRSERPRARRAAPGPHHARLHAPCRRLGAGRVRRHARARAPRASRTACRRSCAARARAGSRPSTACCRARRTRAAPREAARGKQGGRTQEIQRLIGRSLRAVVDLRALGERTITLDCDVLQADGGTRTAAITGAYVALADAVDALIARRALARSPLHGQVAAVSVGIVRGVPVLDLDYAEDSTAETDMNVVMNNGGGFVEVQGTAEGHAFRRHELDALLDLAAGACARLFAAAARARCEAARRLGLESLTAAALPARLVLATGNAGKLRELQGHPRAVARRRAPAVGVHACHAADETGLTFRRERACSRRGMRRRLGTARDRRRLRPGGRCARRRARRPLGALRGPDARATRTTTQSCCDELAGRAGRRRAAPLSLCAGVPALADDPAPLIAQAAWEGRIAASAARQRRLRLRPAVRGRRDRTLPPRNSTRPRRTSISHRGQALRGAAASRCGRPMIDPR